MRSSITGGAIAVVAIIILILAYQSLFEVPQGTQALKIRFGQPVQEITQPCPGDPSGASPAQSHCAGLYFKWPLWIENVVYISARILDLENPAQEVIASDQKRLVVDAFARYRIQEPLKFYQTVGSISVANGQLSTLLNSSLRRVLGEATLTHVVRDERPQLMAKVRDQLDHEAQQFGIKVIDVRIRRADLPEQNSQAVYQRMQTERQREATEIRAQGNQRAQEIKARADRDVTVLTAEANSKSEQTRGQGDAERNRIFAEAYGKDPGFFSFYRSMQAYEAGLRPNDTRLVIKPDSEFFRYFGNPAGNPGQAAAPGDSDNKK
ncbi:MAG: protease modulator HflC [Xanthobacteraceae bacterium]|nr:protease modulator HflC [Xanthobacteraceae bacterium]